MATAVELVGGPLDGERRALPDDAPELLIITSVLDSVAALSPDVKREVLEHFYVREGMRTGGIVQYRYDPARTRKC